MTRLAFRFLPEPLEELLGTQRWYGRRDPLLARMFGEAVVAAVECIRANSQSFPLIHGQIRRLVLNQFSYAIYFYEKSD